MKKLLVLAAVAAMGAMSAKAEMVGIRYSCEMYFSGVEGLFLKMKK